MILKKSFLSYLIFILYLLMSSHFSIANEPIAIKLEATTSLTPSIPLDELDILLTPMTKEELFVEADSWLLLLRTTSKKISIAKLKIKKANIKISNEKTLKKANNKIEKKVKDIKAVNSAEIKEKLKDDLKKEIKSDLKEQIKEFKEDIKSDIKADIKHEIKKELDEVKDQVYPSKKTILKVDVIEEIKEDVLADLDKLRNERRHRVDRLNIVLEAINDKIGLDDKGNELNEVLPYRRYIDTVSGLKLDVTDTKSTWLSVKGYLLSEDGGIKWAINITTLVTIIFVFLLLSKLLGNAVEKALSFSHHKSQILNNFFINSIRRVTFIIGLLVALSAIGISVAPIMAIIGATGFIVAFALQSTLSNFASGIMIMLYRPFDVKDLIEVAGIMGKVKSMTLVSTTIMTPDNKLMIVPNNSIWGDVIVNAHYSSERRVDMVFGIGYEDDIEQAIQVMKLVLEEHPLVLEEPQSVIQVSELADSSVNFICRPWVKTADYWTVYWDVTRAVKEQFDAANISIPFPQTDIHVYQQSQKIEKTEAIAKHLSQEPLKNQFDKLDAEQDD
ncbi:MAG: mechanosensitive ion channel [Gammaproteobacteria bacterium]|nr:mechanosensitive ion channel [Gammaproteobacteria bacterium]